MHALPSPERAAFATSSRLLSCLVTESLVRALYVPLNSTEAKGLCVVLSGGASASAPANHPAYTAADILAIVPLQHVPIFKPGGDNSRGKEIGLLDPSDMLPFVFEVRGERKGEEHAELSALQTAILSTLSASGWVLGESPALVSLDSPVELWNKYAHGIDIEPVLSDSIAEELASSVLWQTYSYDHPPLPPSLESPSVDWEQSIVEGHPTHPMHKMRQFLSPIPPITPGSYDLYNPRIRLAAVPRKDLDITGNFEEHAKAVVEAATENAKATLHVPPDFVVIPIHEIQAHHIQDKFKDAIVYPEEFSVAAKAQQSIRSIVLPDILEDTHLKLGVGLKLTSAVRTISPASAYLGPRFSSQVVPALTMDHSILTVAKELGSVVHKNPDSEIAKHCSAIVREYHENGCQERGERAIVCTSLVESGHAGAPAGVPSVVRIFGLDTEAKRVEWLDKFVQKYFAAFLPPMLENGVAFEAHPQNTIARFSLTAPHELLGFIVRDFGGLRVHPPTLHASTGVTLDAASGHSIIADTLDDVYTRMYHTMIHNHLQQLVRVLGLHYNGQGWDVIRKRLREAIPADHALAQAWLGGEATTLPGKCFMRMRMVGMYRHHLHGPFPNLLHYTGTNEAEEGLKN